MEQQNQQNKEQSNAQHESIDYQAKVLILGNSQVGKSCILLRYVDGKYWENQQSTIGVDFRNKTVKCQNGINILLSLWDTAGQERFRPIIRSFYKSTKACIIVFDLSNRQSLDDINYWMEQIQTNCDPDLPAILVGNKCDIIQQDKQEQEQIVEAFLNKYKIPYVQCSAKENINLDTIFQKITEEIIKYYKIQKQVDIIKDTIQLNNNNKNQNDDIKNCTPFEQKVSDVQLKSTQENQDTSRFTLQTNSVYKPLTKKRSCC